MNMPMRRHDREVTDFDEKCAILEKGRILHVSMIDAGKPYVVPLNYGMMITGSKVELFIHSAPEGRKLMALALNPEVCFETEAGVELGKSDNPCKWTTFYESVIGEGTAVIIPSDDTAERTRGMAAIMLHNGFTGKMEFTPEVFTRTTLIRIDVTDFTGKRHAVPGAAEIAAIDEAARLEKEKTEQQKKLNAEQKKNERLAEVDEVDPV